VKQYQTGSVNTADEMSDMERAKTLDKREVSEGERGRTSACGGLLVLVEDIVHDLKGVMGVIIMSAEQLKDELDKTRDPALVEAILEGAKFCVGLSNRFVAAARGDLISLTEIDLHSIITGCVRLIARSLPAEIGIDIEVRRLIPRIRGDAIQMEQLVMNLCFNALDAMPCGGRIQIRLDMIDRTEDAVKLRSGSVAGGYAVISIEDSGRGISPLVIDRIFERSFSTKADRHGTGLGLATAKKIVETHGGVLTVESEVGRGSVFRAFLPLADSKR